MKSCRSMVLAFCSSLLLGAAAVRAGPLDFSPHPHPENAETVHEVEHAVDHAWEVYHRAALGGTVASPALQAEIEEHLHQARMLVTRAREAAERGDGRQVDRLVGQVKIHTEKAIEGSKEQKK